MKQVKLLDCTLRDGGYVNDWEFGHDNIVTIFERLISAGVDILEVGVPIRFSASWTREIR